MANGTLLDELMAQMKKNKQASSVGGLSPSAPKTSNYGTMFKKALDETYRYAQISPQTARDVANTITPGGAMTAYARGDVQSFNWDEAIQAERDRASATDYFRKSGLYDNDDYLYNDAYRFLVGDDYLKKQRLTLPMGLAASSASDAIEDVRRSLVKNDPRAEWRNFYDLYGYETEQPLEIMLRAEAIAKGTNRTVRDFDLMDDETYDREYEALETWYKGLDPVALTERYDSQTDDYLAKIKTVDKEISRRSEIDEFRAGIRSNEDYGTMSAFTGPGLPEGAWSQTRAVTQEDIDALNDPYSFINSGATWEQLTNSREKLAYVAEYMDAGYNMLTPDEIADYNYLINTGREDDAAHYLELLRPELLLRRAMVAKSWQTVKATNPALAVPTWLEAGIQNLANIAYLPYQFYEAATGRDDPFSPAFDALNKNKWTSEAQLGWIEDSGMADWLKDVTSVVYKGAAGWRDNVIRLAASGFNPTVSLIIAGAQSTSGSLHESSERDDVSGAAKIVKALATGAMEMGTEKIGLDALFSKGHGGALEYLKGVILSELGEESLNYISEPALEAAVAFLFDQKAEIMSGPEFWNGLTDTMLTTAISSILMGGGGAVQMDAGYRRAGKGLRNGGDVESVLQIAEGIGADTTSAQIAKAIRAAEEGGKKVSTRELGKLVSALSSDIGEQNAAAVNAVYEDAIADRLIELGEEKSKARKQAKVIRRISAGEVLSVAERMSVNWSDNASQVVRELTTEVREGDEGRVGRDWKVRAVQLAEEASAPYVDKGIRFEKALRTKPGTTTETQAESPVSSDTVAQQGEEMAAAGKNKFGHKPPARAVIFDADGAEQTGEVIRFEKDKDGMHAVVATTADGKTANVTVDLESITASASAGIGSIVRYVQNASTRGHDMSAAEASTMIRLYEQEGGDAKTFIDGFEKAYLAGYAGIEFDSAGISEGVAKIAFDQGKAEAAADEKGRVARATRVRADSKGVVSWLGKVSSGKEVRGTGDPNALSAAMRKMTSSQRTTVQVVQAFADKFKTNVVLFESSEENIGSIENGSYDPNTNTIYIDINSGADSAESIKAGRKHNTLGHAMVRTLGHELTHHLESTSPEAYATYKQAVKTALKEQGQDWATLVRGKLDTARNAGRKLTYAGAEAEVIADASEYMLQNSKFVKEIDNSTKGRVKKFIKDFMKKLGEVFSTLTRSHTESAALRKEIDGVKQYMGNLQQLWDAAMEETMGTVQDGVVEATSDVADALYETGEYQSDDATHPMQRQLSVRQLAESLGYELKMLEGTDVPYAIVDSNGREVTTFTADQVRNTPLGGLIDAAVAAGNIDARAQQEQLKMIADLATLAAQYKDQAMVWEIAGSQLYSAIKNNSDKQYNKTVDFGTICSKTQAVVDVLSETMLKLDRGLTREEVITAYNKTAKNGLSVPCGPCYVFSRWMGVPGLLNSMANYQSRFGSMTAEEVTAYIDSVQARYSSDGERFSKVIGKQKTKLENRLESIASRMQKAMATGGDMTALFREADEVEREYADVEAYNWVTQVLCQSKRVKGAIEVLRDADGVVKLDPSYKPVPHSILFDMRRTGEFAKYPKSWKYRSTRGAGMGKSILPYSGAGLGDTVYGEQKRRTASQNAFLNPNMTKTQRIRAIKNATKRMKSQNLIGGHRFQSTSDYRPEWGLDYIMTFLEMQAVGAKGQLYTKVIEAVDMFATAGIEVNLSIMANGDGWHYDKNGKPVLGVEDFSSVSGINFIEALKKTREYDNVQMILVGMNDTHIRLALADDRITFVIPWHSSGSSESILKQLFDAVGEELHTGSDYQDIQSDKPVSHATEEQKRNMALRTKIITGKFAKVLPTDTEREAIEANEFLNDLYTRFYLDPSATDTYGVKLSSEQASQVFPYEYWDTNLTYENADENGRRFVRYCESIGLVPRFEKFKNDHGYWKLLIDRRMYNRDGSYHTPEVIDVTGVEIGDIASSVSQAKYGDPVKTGNAVMETVEELRTKAGTPAYPEPSITSTMEGYGDEVEVEPRPAQQSARDLTDTAAFKEWFGNSQVISGEIAVVFDPAQIKSATDNVGTFDPNSPDIRYSTRDLPPEVTAREFLAEADSSIAETVEERNALSIYQGLLLKHADASDKVIAAERVLAVADEEDLPEARKALTAARARQKELYNRLLNVERTAHVQTIVKRTNRIISDLSGKNQAEMDKMVSALERKVESLRLDLQGLKVAAKTQREADARASERDIVAHEIKAAKEQREADLRAAKRELAVYKSKAAQVLIANNEKHTKRIADLRERNELNVEIGKKARHIKRVIKRLNDRIIHEEDYKNVKEPLKPAVHNLVRAFIDGFGNLVFDQKTADRLRTVYDKIADEKEGSPDFYSDDVANWLTDLAALAEEDEARRIAGGSSLESVEQKLETYNRVAEIADHIYKMVAEADEIFVNGKRESFAAISGEVGGGLVSKKDKPLLVGKAREAVRIFDDLIRTGNMTPQYFFDHLKNSGLSKLFSGLMTGQTQYAQRIREGQETIADAKRRYNFYAWKNMKQGVEFKTEQGHTISLTVPQMMWVYATAKREATNTLMDTHHLDEGGFRYEANDLPKQKGKLTAIPGIDRLHKLSANDVAKITATLTAEQIACADELVSYLSNECAEQGNAASMELFGIKKYNEEYYFPFKTASDQRYQRSDAGSTSTTNDARVKHASFTHSLRKGANTALVMGDFFDVIADHINLMATYSSFVVPIESMNRVLNTKINEEKDGSGNDVTIRSLVGRKHGDPAQKYIADLMKDLNGGPQTDNRGGISGLFRAFKRGAVMGSLSVALQQPTAIVRAFAYVNPKYFAHITMEGNKKTWERMMKYSGTTVIKDMGKFDVGTGRMANDWIANSDTQDYKLWQRAKFLMDTKGWKAVKDNFIETMTALPGVMDRITWSHIWKAIEAEQADLNPSMDRNSDEFLRTVGARFDDVINHTQVYDSILVKSQNMRSKNPLAQMSTAFMSEPTLNINMLYDAVRGDHSKGQRASIITSVVTSNILAAAASALIAAWNKDDDDRNAAEKYLTTFASRALDNLNPLTMVPYVADLWNLVNGYDIERTDWSVIKDAWNYGSTFMSKAFDPEKENTWRDYENFFGTIANLFGIPAKNVSRDIRRARNFLATDKSPAPGSNLKYALVEELTPFGLYKSSNSAYCQRLVAAVVDGDTQEAYDLWDYMTNGKKMSQGSLETNIRSELKRLVKAGEITPAQATAILRKYVPYKDDKNNVKYPQDWLNEKE